MNARCEVVVGDSNVVVKILHGREKVHVFINEVKQNASENTCKFLLLISCCSSRPKVFEYFFAVTFRRDQVFMMKASDQSLFGSCALPEDTVNPLDIN